MFHLVTTLQISSLRLSILFIYTTRSVTKWAATSSTVSVNPRARQNANFKAKLDKICTTSRHIQIPKFLLFQPPSLPFFPSYFRGKWSSAFFPLYRSLVNTQKLSWSYHRVIISVVSSANSAVLEISNFKAPCVQKHTQKRGLFDEASRCWKGINTSRQKTQFPCRSFHLGVLDGHQYRPLALRTGHLQLHKSFTTNFKQKGSHSEAKSHW